MQITPKTKLDALIEKYPFCLPFLVDYHPRFALLEDRCTRTAMGHACTLRRVAAIGGVDLTELIQALAKYIQGATGDTVTAGGLREIDRAQREERIQAVQRIVRDLFHTGEVAAAQREILDLGGFLEPGELAAAEAALIDEGLPADEVMHLCELHVNALNGLVKRDTSDLAPGHPVSTYIEENKEIVALAKMLAYLGKSLRATSDAGSRETLYGELDAALRRLEGVEVHYLRKENQLFPILERRGITGPPVAMWAAHDETRAHVQTLRAAASARDAAAVEAAVLSLCKALVATACMENEVLFPIALNALTAAEWVEVRRGEDELGYAFVQPRGEWLKETVSRAAEGDGEGGAAAAPEIALDSGRVLLGAFPLSVEQIALLFDHLPVEISFVDERDEVRYFNKSGHRRIFARGDDAVGRRVQRCHPPKSLAAVNRILSDFRRKKRDTAEFWFPRGDRLVHVRYFALRDAGGAYRGCLEVSQDITDLQKLTGEKRLLD